MTDREQIKLEESNGVLTATYDDGKTEEFCEPIRSLSIEAKDLQITHSFDWNAKEIRLGRSDSAIVGQGLLSKGDALCVIGKKHTKSEEISLSIRPADFNSHLDLEDPPINASLSFNESDWEIGNDSVWWVDLYMPNALFDELTSLVNKRKLESLSIRLKSKEFLVRSFDFHTPPSGRITWYIKDGQYSADLINCSTATFYIKERKLICGSLQSGTDQTAADKSLYVEDGEGGIDQAKPTPLNYSQLKMLSNSLKAIFWGLIAVAAAIMFQK